MAEPAEITPEQEEELRQLRSQYVVAAKKALRAIMTAGMSSTAYRDAEKEAALIVRRIEEILGTSGNHWWRGNV
jgi:hypothetical protein